MPIDYRALLRNTSQDVVRPKSAPACWLVGTIGPASFDATKGESETPYVSFELNTLEFHPDTEEDLMEGVNLERLKSPYRKTLAVDYWLADDQRYILADMLDRVIGDPERTLEERIPELRGVRVMFKVTPYKNKNSDEDTGQNAVGAWSVRPA